MGRTYQIESRPDLDGREDPDRLLLTLDDRSDLIRLKLRDPEPSCVSIVEAATCSRQPSPASDRQYSRQCLDSSNHGLVQTFDAEARNLIKGVSTMLESMVRRPGIGAERLLAYLASVSTALPPSGLIETKTNDVSDSGFPRWRAFPVGTVEAFYGF